MLATAQSADSSEYGNRREANKALGKIGYAGWAGAFKRPNSGTELKKEQQNAEYKKYRTKDDFSLKQAIPNKLQIAVSIKRIEIAPCYLSMNEI
jgi:hypothetical protein